MWPATFSADNDPRCASSDGDTPDESSDIRTLKDPQKGPCADCPSARFTDDGPPACKLQRNFLVWLVENGEPAILTMQSTALKTARHLTTLAKAQGLRKSIVFTTQSIKSDQGNWFVPAFTKGERISNDALLALVEARNEMENLVIQADVSAEMREENSEQHTESDGTDEDIPF